MRMHLFAYLAISAFAAAGAVSAQNKNPGVEVTVKEADGGRPVQGAVVVLRPGELWAVSDSTGTARFSRVAGGSFSIETSMLGYITRRMEIPEGSGRIVVNLVRSNLAIKDVVVTAKRLASPGSTSTVIERQAIDHLQATSLADLMQLLPGETVSSNPSLTTSQRLILRSLDSYDSNNSFGSAIVMDGIPVAVNAERAARGGTLSNSGAGADLRSFATDAIESVEVIRGIPSAEFGDLSSGAMIVRSKSGISDLRASLKIFPGITQASLGKGFRAGRRSTVNIAADFADGKSDPRYRTDTYRRISLHGIHTMDVSHSFRINSKILLGHVEDWSGPDPSEPISDIYARTRENSLRLSSSGRLIHRKWLPGAFKYDISAFLKLSDSRQRALLRGSVPLVNSTESGTFRTSMLPEQYYGTGGTQSRPFNFFMKVSDSRATSAGAFSGNLTAGLEYRTDGNFGRGFRDDDASLPLSKSGWRPVDYRDTPFLHQAAAFAEESFTLKLRRSGDYPRMTGRTGLRLTAFQPLRKEGFMSFSPRVNLAYEHSRVLRLRIGYGITDKMPSQAMMYPVAQYVDIMNVNSYKDDSYLGIYTTWKYSPSPGGLRPMTSRKAEAGMEVKTAGGLDFSVTGYVEKVKDGFGASSGRWNVLVFDKLDADGGFLRSDTLLTNISSTANTDYHLSRGIEFEFNPGKITGKSTSFILSGAYISTDYHSLNEIYAIPRGHVETYSKTYVIYPPSCRDNRRRRFSGTLRVVQRIPRLSFVLSGAIQGIIYDYSLYTNTMDSPSGYIAAGTDGSVISGRFSAEDFRDSGSVLFRGYSLKDQIIAPGAYTGIAEVWPSLWTFSLRASKNVSGHFDLSFYVNNLFFNQPWQKSSVSAGKVERNSNLFAYGFEASVHF